MSSARLVVVSLLFLLPNPSRAQTLDLTPDQARLVLHKHCAKCHDGEKPKGGRSLLDPKQIAAVVKPGDAKGSELLQLVESGMMPRGKGPKVPAADVKILHDWIEAGAKPFTAVASDEYVLRHILLDQRSRQGTPRDRYFAFNHLPASTASDSPVFKDALTIALNLLPWKSNEAKAVAIDPAGSVFRVDLSALGWEAQPFESKTVGKDAAKSDVNLFDLVLLEYPYAALPTDSPDSAAFYAVDQEYLQPAKLVRPIPFVRGDWFVDAAAKAKFGSVAGDRSELIEMSRRLGKARPVAPGNATALPPLDGLTYLEHHRNPRLKADVAHYKVGEKPEKVSMLKPGERFFLVVNNDSSTDLFVELVSISPRGRISSLPLPATPVELKAGKELRIPPGNNAFVADAELGKSRLVLFASDAPFTPCAVLSAANRPDALKSLDDRLVHPFVDISGQKRSRFNLNCDPRRMMKLDFEIETKP
jgi:hypothetical protein